jgi:hypothetical protein
MTCGDERTRKHDGWTFCTSTLSGIERRNSAKEGSENEGEDEGVVDGG